MKFYDREDELNTLKKNWEQSASHSMMTTMIGRFPAAKRLRKISIPTTSPFVAGNLRVADQTNGKRTKMDHDGSEQTPFLDKVKQVKRME